MTVWQPGSGGHLAFGTCSSLVVNNAVFGISLTMSVVGYNIIHFNADITTHPPYGGLQFLHSPDIDLSPWNVGSPPPGGDTSVLGPQSITCTWSMAYTGTVLRRGLTGIQPDTRSVMNSAHDIAATDGWYVKPGATATATFVTPYGTLTLSIPLNTGTTDLPFDFGTSALIGAFQANCAWATTTGGQQGQITTDWSFGSGSLAFPSVPGSTVAWSGGTATYTVVPGSAGGLDEEWFVSVEPPYKGSFGAMAYQFDERGLPNTETLAPLWTGFEQADGSGGWTPVSLATLPAFNIFEWSVAGYTPPNPPAGTLRPANLPTIAIGLDETWLKQQQLFVGLDSGQNNRACALEISALNQGVGPALPQTLIVATPQLPQFFPVAADKANLGADPNARWTPTGDLVGNRDPAQPTKLLRWYWPASHFAGGASGVTGNLTLAIQTRYWDYLAQCTATPYSADWECYWLRARRALDTNSRGVPVPPGVPQNYPEDLFSWSGNPYVAWTINKPKGAAISAQLVVNYSEVEVEDTWNDNLGRRAEGFTYQNNPATVTYSVTWPAVAGEGNADSTANIDLLCPDDGSIPHLFILNSVAWQNFTVPYSAAIDPGGAGIYLDLYGDDPTKALHWILDTGSDQTTTTRTPCWRCYGGAVDYPLFAAYWGAMQHQAMGDLQFSRLPGEPFANGASEVPAFGLIQHNTDDVITTELDVLRASGQGMIPFICDTFTAVYQSATYSAMYTSMGPTTVESIPDYLDHLAPAKFTGAVGLAGAGGFNIQYGAAIRAANWTLAPGVSYTILVRQPLYGETRMLLKTSGGRKRVTPDVVAAAGGAWQFVIFEKIVGYSNGGASIADPAGAPASGYWKELVSGAVSDHLDGNGVFCTPPMKPAVAGIWDTGITNPALQTEEVTKSRWLWFWNGSGWASYIDPTTGYYLETTAAISAMRADPNYLGDNLLGSAADEGLWQLVQQTITPIVPGGNIARLRCGEEAIARGGYLYTRPNTEAAWQQRVPLPDLLPVQLLACKNTDDIAFVETTPRQSRDLGATIIAGTPSGAVPGVADWATVLAPAIATDCRQWPDGFGMVVGNAGNTISAAGISTGTPSAVVVATVAEGIPCPLLARDTAGRFRIFEFTGGVFRSFLSLDGGVTWAPDEVQSVANANFLTATLWQARDGMQLVAGLNAGAVLFTYRGAQGQPWAVPTAIGAATSGPYVVESGTGRIEVGWFDGTAWQRYQAQCVLGPWSAVA